MDGRTADIRRAVWRLLAGILVLLSVVGGADAAAPSWACRVDGGDAECRAPEVGPPWWNTAELGEFQDHCGNPFPDGQVRCPSEELSWTQSDAELTAAWLACSIDRDLLREEEQTYLGVVKSIKKDYAITITHSNPYDSAPCQRTYTVSLLGFVWATADRDVSCPPGYTPSAQGCWRAKPEA
ncbi:MAG TPA: hypothetical protein VFN09_07505, partial [Rhodanobacteraceae bacterium]|nr:hypothetical protein [Rhodanobacteraceae bacterium]